MNVNIDTSTFKPENTGLKFRVSVYAISNAVPRHKPRVKVIDSKGQFSMYISDNPLVSSGNPDFFESEHIEELKEWIILNKQVLLDYWYDHIDTLELVYKLQRI